jgi:hypothetical protein
MVGWLSSVVLGMLVVAPGASAASLSILAPASAARAAPLALTVSGVAPPVTPGAPPGAQSFAAAWVQSLKDGPCPAQEPETAPQDAWGMSPSDNSFTPGAPFSERWNADSSYVALGSYYICAWTMDDLFNTAAAAQALLTIRPPIFRLSLTVPHHARVGARRLFAVTASLETPSLVGILLLPQRAYVCDLSGTTCKPRRLTSCPASYSRAADLAANSQTNVTPFDGANFADPPQRYHGQVRFRARLKALSPGRFHFCAYAREDAIDAPTPFAEVHASAAFRVT